MQLLQGHRQISEFGQKRTAEAAASHMPVAFQQTFQHGEISSTSSCTGMNAKETDSKNKCRDDCATGHQSEQHCAKRPKHAADENMLQNRN